MVRWRTARTFLPRLLETVECAAAAEEEARRYLGCEDATDWRPA